MSKQRPTKSLEALDRHILADRQSRDPQQLAQVRQRFFTLLGLGMLVTGMLMFIIGTLEARKLINDWQWPTTSGVYVDGWLQTSRNGSLLNAHYCLDSTFSYEINGDSYESSSIATDCSNSREEIDDLVDSYSRRGVTIWYDPTDISIISHTRIGLERPMILWGASVFLVAMSGIFIYFALQQTPEKIKTAPQRKQPARPL